MTRPKTLVLPPAPPTGLPPRLSGWLRAQQLQRYALDVYDALARACQHQVGAVLPEPSAIAAHFKAFTMEQATLMSAALHERYGVSLPAGTTS
ncbi:hypothetical protein AB0A63_31560 [Lentzea sp. NPDC042327]|uniref:hypothetical protein n=1 Tax=Lentzea sp. NPDC042327 TaxID=3154801 RepID=UPI0033E6100C